MFWVELYVVEVIFLYCCGEWFVVIILGDGLWINWYCVVVNKVKVCVVFNFLKQVVVCLWVNVVLVYMWQWQIKVGYFWYVFVDDVQ